MMMDKCMVMQNGFQFSIFNDQCLLFLFPGWNINTHLKYVFAIIGVFCLGLSNELLIHSRHLLSTRLNTRSSLIVHQLCLSFVYGIHMLLAYGIMLLVMTYDVGFFITLLLGLVSGHFIFGIIRCRNDALSSEKTPLIGLAGQHLSLSTPCCQSTNEVK
ncbi:hypothetical protein I4U23_025096 [Adineta vaga]|nr:hypothetical protein I4U23_025091 [Adineta vaga]UJR22029.1 hypothetical protein I4U23_025096 [Adineta vaga]